MPVLKPYGKHMKYKLTKESIICEGRTFYRIKALKSFSNVKKNDLGGYIEKKNNLSQKGNCWVYENAKVSGSARVYEDAWVSDSSLVSGNARVSGDALISGTAWIYENAKVSGNAIVYGNARVYGRAWVSGNARVYGDAIVSDSSLVSGTALVSGNAMAFEGNITKDINKKSKIPKKIKEPEIIRPKITNAIMSLDPRTE